MTFGPSELLLLLGLLGFGAMVVLGAAVLFVAASRRRDAPAPVERDEPERHDEPEPPRPHESTAEPERSPLEQLLLQIEQAEGTPEDAELALLMRAVAEASGDDGLAWRGTWRGHEVVLQSRTDRHTLHVDGRLVAEASGQGAIRGTIDGAEVVAAIRSGPGRRATLRIDGGSVNLQRQPYDETLAPVEPDPPAPDPRLAAVEELVAQMQARGGDVASLATRGLAEVRGLLEQIAAAETARASHQQLSGDGDDRLGRLVAHHEGQVDRLITALRDLHLKTVDQREAADAPARLLAELEVEAAVEPGTPDGS
jgi:hypothetical protein